MRASKVKPHRLKQQLVDGHRRTPHAPDGISMCQDRAVEPIAVEETTRVLASVTVQNMSNDDRGFRRGPHERPVGWRHFVALCRRLIMRMAGNLAKPVSCALLPFSPTPPPYAPLTNKPLTPLRFPRQPGDSRAAAGCHPPASGYRAALTRGLGFAPAQTKTPARATGRGLAKIVQKQRVTCQGPV